MTAAVLLLFPRIAHIGAMLFLPIIVNIAVLTCSVGFKGTWLLTIFMSLAAAWLMAWEYDRLKPILFSDRQQRPTGSLYQFIVLPLFFAAGGALLAAFAVFIRLGNFSNYILVGLSMAAGGFLFGFILALHYRLMPVGSLRESGEPL